MSNIRNIPFLELDEKEMAGMCGEERVRKRERGREGGREGEGNGERRTKLTRRNRGRKHRDEHRKPTTTAHRCPFAVAAQLE